MPNPSYSAAIAALSSQTPFTLAGAGDPRLQRLVTGQLFQGIKLIFGPGSYLDYSLQLGSQGNVWSLQRGSFNYNNSILGNYWVFRTDVEQCWQANQVSGPLSYWNPNNASPSPWPPQDWELMLFRISPSDPSRVVVKNVWDPAHHFLRLAGTHFRFDGDINSATSFGVEL